MISYRFFSLIIILVFIFFLNPLTIHASQTTRLYVSNAADAYISVVDTSTHNLIKTIQAGDQPRKVIKQGRYIYVANMYSHSISVIDSDTNNVLHTISVGGIYPERIFLSKDGKRLYSGDAFSTTLDVIDTTTNTVNKILTGFDEPITAIENPLGTKLYVVNQNYQSNQGYVSVLDTSDYSTIAVIPVGYEAVTLSITPDGSKVYVGNDGGANKGNTVSVINTTTNTITKTINVGINPYDIEINSLGTRAYVLNTFFWDNQSGSTISVIDTATDTVKATIPVGGVANSMTISDDDSKLYVTKDNSGTVDVVSTITNNVIDTIPAGDHPWGVAELVQESNDLSVPVLKQTSDPWQSNVYDGADKWSPLTPTINRWGCALTSAAMILRYYGINQLPDNTPLDPGSLNTWLKSRPDGYIGNGAINWLAISKLSKDAKANNPSFANDALEFHWSNGYHPEQLATDIQNGQPDILEEPGHFIVAKGISGNTFSINDPFYNISLLSDSKYNNSFLSLRRYIPSHTDLSYIMLVTNQATNLSLQDSNGNELGQSVIEQSITDPLSTDFTNSLPLKILYFQKPSTDNYRVVLSSQNSELYYLSSYLYDKNGEVNMATVQGTASPDAPDTITLNYNKEQLSSSSLSKVITYQTTLDDITKLQSVGQITKDSIANKLTRLINQANDAEQRDMLDQKNKKLDAFRSEVETDRGNDILDAATTILLEDVSALSNQ